MTKVEQVSSVLRERIQTGEWSSGKSLPSRGQLSIEYGVSQATITSAIRELQKEGLVRVMQGKGAYVADFERTGAIPIPNAVVGLTGSYIPSGEELSSMGMDQLFSRSIFDGIWQAANAEHCPVVLMPKLAMQAGVTREYCRQVGVQGLIFLGGEGYQNAFSLKKEGFPVILANKPAKATPLNYVDYDNYFVVREVVRRFAEAGHKRIAVIYGEGSVPEYYREMRLQFLDSLQEHGLCYDIAGYWRGVTSRYGSPERLQEIEQITESLLSLSEPPTAIFCWEPLIWTTVEKALIRNKQRVPQDVSVMVSSYENKRDIGCSGFVMPHQELGKALLKHLCNTIRNPHYSVQELLKPAFVDKGTVTSL